MTGLTVNGNISVTTGAISGNGEGLTNLGANRLSSGTIPDARFPSTLPTASGANLTNLNASNLSSGTMPAARLPNHSAALLTSGTIPDARLANSSLFVTGMILMYTGSTAPSGWAICNGSNGTPDLRDRFIVGAGSAYSVNNTGGAASVTLTTAQIPSHNHSFSGSSSHSHTINNHTHSFSGSGSSSHSHSFTGVYGNDHNDSQKRATVMRNDRNSYDTAAGGSGVQSASVSISISGTTGGVSDRGTNSQTVSISGNTGNKGSGNSHENRPPYYALMFIMKL